MKKLFLLLVAAVASLISCKKELAPHSISVSGQLLEEVTLEPLPNASIGVSVTHSYKDGWGNSYIDTLDNKWITTDAKGNFSVTMKYRDESNELGFTISPEDPVYMNMKNGARNISYFKTASNFTLYSRTWEKILVRVKNVNPVDDNDNISVSVQQGNTWFVNSVVTKIVNHGAENIHLVSPGVDFRLYPAWKGKNVDSEIYGNIQSSTVYRVFWTVIKNGERKEYMSPEFVTQKGKLNEFNLEY